MARIRKVAKANKGMNMCNEESTDKKLDKSMIEVSPLNSRKLCNNDINRRILLNLKSYPNLFLTGNLVTAVRKCSISASTQTNSYDGSDNGKKSMSTQTNFWVQKGQGLKEINVMLVRKSKSDSSLLQNYDPNTKSRPIERIQISDLRSLNNQGHCEDSEIHKNIIILHKNENMDSTKTKKKTKRTKTKFKTEKKFNSTVYAKKRVNRQFRTYEVLRKLRKATESKENNPYSYDQFIKRVGKYSLTTIAKCSSKIIQIVSDFGLSLTESLINLYKLYESHHKNYPKTDQLELKLNQLEDSLHISQAKIYEQQRWMESTNDLVGKLEEVKQKLASYDLLKLELADIKKQLNGSNERQPVTTPLPPPPPPLPIFSLTTNCASKTFLKVVQNEEKINGGSSRPMITLEDILKVKLKKISVTTNI